MKCFKCGRKLHDTEIQSYFKLCLYECSKCGNENLVQETDLAKIVYGKEKMPIRPDLTVAELIEMIKENKMLKAQYSRGMDLQIQLSLEEDDKKKE